MKQKLKGWKLPIVAVVALLFALISIATRKPLKSHPPVEVPPTSTYSATIAGIGLIEPKSELISVATEMGGVIREVYVKVGQSVKQGQPLFSLDQRDIDAQIITLKAAVNAAKANADNLSSQYDSTKSLPEGAISKEEFKRRKFASESAAAQLAQAKAQLQHAVTTKARMTISAPISGQILSVNARPGEYASLVQTEPLIRMGDTHTLHVRVEIDEYNASQISQTATATATIRGESKTSISLELVRIEPYVKPKQNLITSGQRVDTRVVQLIYRMVNPPKTALVGQQVDVFINQGQK
jgi:HlyD family secretion protein